MRKIIAAMFAAAIVFLLGACVPKQQDSQMAPDMSPKESVEYDFVQLHNDTLKQFEGADAYAYVTDLSIDGDNESKTVRVKVTSYNDVTPEIAEYFASAVLHRINDAAMTQDVTVEQSSNESFGTFWNKFNFVLQVYSEEEAAKENGTPVYELQHTAGEAIDLDTDISAYEEEFERQMEILLRNEE